MHFTLWQQFSSNHSTGYSVVGVFPTSTVAHDVCIKLREIIQAIADDNRASYNELSMNAAEIRIAEQYKINWYEGLDWLHAMNLEPNRSRNPPYTVEDAVNIVDNLVIVDAPLVFTEQSGHQFAALIRAMDGVPFRAMIEGPEPEGVPEPIFRSDIYYFALTIEITCTAPSLETATEITTLLINYFQNDWKIREKLPMPWTVYHPYLSRIAPNLTPETYTSAEQDWLKGEKGFNWEISELRQNTYLDGICDVDDNKIKLKVEAQISYTAVSLIALISWLKAQGCTDFQYEFQQRSG